MNAIQELPAFGPYALTSAILILHLVVLALWTATVRAMRKEVTNPEDVVFGERRVVDADHPDVRRVKRAHQNALENALPFLAIGLLYVLSGGTRFGGQLYGYTFLAARLLHSLFYLARLQPYRTIAFSVGALVIVGLAVQVGLAALAAA
jgi:uncharacterized MAPEG superfamily protein